MSTRNWTVAILTLGLAVSARYVLGQDAAPATQPTVSSHSRLPADFARMTDLTDDQKSQILAIRATADEAIHQLEVKEKADEENLLSDAQKDELKDIDTKLAAERRSHLAEERREERIENTQEKLDQLKNEDQPTTNPSAPN
ncbi:MAG TPA: hypothetical protein VL992_19010 [Tepidisphaeraceae bacterium]|nr:hypothetical protein [Tepidisphaeraceae bacterium]